MSETQDIYNPSESRAITSGQPHLTFMSEGGQVREAADPRFGSVDLSNLMKRASGRLAEYTRSDGGEDEKRRLVLRACSDAVESAMPYDASANFFTLDSDHYFNKRPVPEIGFTCQDRAPILAGLTRRLAEAEDVQGLQFATPITMYLNTNHDLGHATTFIPLDLDPRKSFFCEPGEVPKSVEAYINDPYWSPSVMYWPIYFRDSHNRLSVQWKLFDPLKASTWPIHAVLNSQSLPSRIMDTVKRSVGVKVFDKDLL